MDKQIKIFIGAIGVVLILIIGGLIFFAVSKKRVGNQTIPAPIEQNQQTENSEPTDAEIQAQLKQLDEMRKEGNISAPTDEEIKKQLDELDAMREKSGIKPPTQEEIDAQLKQLDEMRKKK